MVATIALTFAQGLVRLGHHTRARVVHAVRRPGALNTPYVPARAVSPLCKSYSTGAAGQGIEEIEFNPMAANTIQLIGNVGRKPEPKYLESGSKVCNFPLAFTDRKDGDTQWFDVEAWDELADIAANNVDKGDRVALQGRLKVQDWTDREGNTRKSLRIVAQNIMRVRRNSMMMGDGDGQFQQPGQQSQPQQPPQFQPSAPPQAVAQQQPQAPQDPTYQSTDMPMTNEELWMNFFENSSGWYDNREKKQSGQINPKSPDFKKMEGGRDAPALWIESSSTPAWVKSELAKLDQFGSDVPPF
jgi:single-strand DNA-binding protein